ncbi:MAG: nucleotide exchange factor GrpE, partial [Candidatus Omnitrophica bacterium]|nr:nucleotide exchange factor GrpE [Candidatus Omnitrophota bacterium]
MKEKNGKQKDLGNHQEETPEVMEVFGEEPMVSLKESEYQKLVKELTESKDKNLRLCAEFDNVRKRMDREKLDFLKYANQELLADFLDILDDLERSV